MSEQKIYWVDNNGFSVGKLLDDDRTYAIPYSIHNVDDEINKLTEEIQSLDYNPLEWDKGDYIVVFLAGVLGGLCDIFIGKPGGYAEPKVADNSFLGLGKYLKEYDIKKNPIDATIPEAFAGDHRLFSYGHDLFRFIKGAYLILHGKGPVGLSPLGGEVSLGQLQEGYVPPKSFFEAALVLLLHLYKDFWTARSLPIPGVTIIANLNNDKMPQIIDDLTNKHDINLRQLSGQVLSVTVIELSIRIWLYFKYFNFDVDKTKIDNKRNRMLLLGHSIGMLFNAGKIIVTKNPFYLNLPQIIRILTLSIKVLKENLELNNIAKIKVESAVLKNKYETLKTLIILHKTSIYTNDAIENFRIEEKEFYNLNESIEKTTDKEFNGINDMLKNFSNLKTLEDNNEQ